MDAQEGWFPPRMGSREHHALSWLATVEPPAGVVIPASLWLPASRASGLKVAQVKRLARRAAEAGDIRLAWYAAHLERLRRRAHRGPGDFSRVRLADWLRRRGLTWPQVASACGYATADSGNAARKAVRRYRRHLESGNTIPQARAAYQLRRRGEPWADIARRTGYASDRAARGMAKRFAARAGLPWPVPSLETEAHGR